MGNEKAKPCTCQTGDRFAAVPPELRPPPKKRSDLRKVTCPGCGLVFWSNRRTDLCMGCEHKGLKRQNPAPFDPCAKE